MATKGKTVALAAVLVVAVSSGGAVRAEGTQLAVGIRSGPAAPVWAASSTPGAARTVVLPVVHTRSVNAGEFLRDEDDLDVTMSQDIGLRWEAGVSDRAGFYMERPVDWDGQSPVTVRITFALGSASAGTVNWRLFLNSYVPNSGEWLTNPGARDADSVLVFANGLSFYRIYDQTFSLAATELDDEPYWAFSFQRGDGNNAEVFGHPLYVLGADVEYQVDVAGLDFFPSEVP